MVDDENSQAEGTIEGAVGYARIDQQLQQQPQPQQTQNNTNQQQQQQQQPQSHPHYENIYESIEQYNAAAHGGAIVGAAVVGAAAAVAPISAANNANAPAEEPQQQQPQPQPQALQQPPTTNNENNTQQAKQSRLAANNINFRNDLYDRSSAININAGLASASTNGYDIPRAVRSGLGFRRNFQLDLHAANPRFNAFRCNGVSCNHYNTATSANSSSTSSCHRQRSFDDTESQNYYNLNHYQPPVRYENIYEQIRDEPIYRNANGGGARVYGRLNVIGHGIGRIERHLSSSCGNIDHYNLGGHYAVLGHSHFGTVGHIRLNTGSSISSTTNGSSITSTCNSSNCSVASGAVGATSASSTSAQKDSGSNNVKNSSSFFSCLHGENTQSMSNIYKASANGGSSSVNSHLNMDSNNLSVNATPNNSKGRESRAASAGPLINPNANGNTETAPTTAVTKTTGAIPKIKALNLGSKQNSNTLQQNSIITTTEKTTVSSLKNALTKKSTSSSIASTTSSGSAQKAQTFVTTSSNSQNSTMAEQNNTTFNRISKSSLQWLLVNKWLPLWMGQGSDCKVIDFNFMFSRDCVDCDAASAAAQMANPYGTPRLSGLPQDIVRFNARAEMHAAAAYRRQNDLNSTRPVHNTLNRLRETEPSPYSRRYEDPSYENVHVQWQNGFEFGRSRDYDHSISAATGSYQSPATQRAPLQRARSESPTLNQRNNAYTGRRLRPVNNLAANHSTAIYPSSSNSTNPNNVKFKDFYRNYDKGNESNNFKANLKKAETLDMVESVATLTLPKPGAVNTAETSPLEDLEGAVGGLVEINVSHEVSTSSAVMTTNNEMSSFDTPAAVHLLDNDNLPTFTNNLDVKTTTNPSNEQKDI